MKTTLVSLFLLFTSLSVWAQQPEPTRPAPKKFYVGIDFNVTPYYFNSRQTGPGRFGTSFTPYPGIHVGYQLSNRARVQVGAAYGSSRVEAGSTYNNNGVIEGDYETIKSKGLIIPVSFRYDFLNVSKRLQAYGFATLTTAYGRSDTKINTARDGVVTNTYKANTSSVSLFLGVGLGASYQLNNRFGVFGEYSIINRNLSGGWIPNRRGLDIGLLNMGLNYKF